VRRLGSPQKRWIGWLRRSGFSFTPFLHLTIYYRRIPNWACSGASRFWKGTPNKRWARYGLS